MGIKTDEMGLAYTASMAAPGHEVAVMPLIGKLRLHIQGYVGHEEIYIMPLEGCDVLLGISWFYNHKAVLDSFNKTITLEIRCRKIVLDVKLKGESVPLVSASAVPRLMKQHISTYLIYVKEKDETESSNLSSLDVSRRAFLDDYANCFLEALPGQLPLERPEDHNIDLIPGSAAPNKPPWRISSAQQEEIMTALNKITVKNKFPIPHIVDVLDRLQGASFFSRIDRKSGYHQIRITLADVPKTTFKTTFGLYEFLVMPFGLTNAPWTFNRMMDIIFRPLRHCVGTFFDDMIVFSKSEAEHMEHLRAVFEMLRKKRLVVNEKKREVKVIIVGNGGVGKTSLIRQFCKSHFLDDYKKTIGVDFLEKHIYVKSLQEDVKLMLWDTAGQEEFNSMTRSYYRGAKAAVLCFSTTDRFSFESLESWKKKVEEQCGRIPMVLVQTKVDLLDEAAVERYISHGDCFDMGGVWVRAVAKVFLSAILDMVGADTGVLGR
ncbi:hypothetical protein L7F22_010667 [Adiantum nelumboides]|nr:hypothetical protein [Adiantum nelumboides]